MGGAIGLASAIVWKLRGRRASASQNEHPRPDDNHVQASRDVDVPCNTAEASAERCHFLYSECPLSFETACSVGRVHVQDGSDGTTAALSEF